MRLFCLIGLLCGFQMAVAAPPALNDFVNTAQVGRLDLSPDGKHIAMIVPREHSADLVVLDRATMQPTANVKQAEGDYISDYWWVRDDRLVIALASKPDDRSAPQPTGELWGVNADGTESSYLFGYRRGGGGKASHIQNGKPFMGAAVVLEGTADERGKILIGMIPFTIGERGFMQLARMSVDNGAVTRAGTAPVFYFAGALTDHQQKLRFISGSGADRLQNLYYRSSPDADWTLLNDAAKTGRTVDPLAYAADGKQVYARVDEGKGPAFFVRLDPETGTEKIMLRPKTASPGGVILTADGRDAFALRTFDGRGGYAFIKPNSPEAKLTQQVMQSFPGELAIANSFSRDGQYATVFVTSDVNPGEYFLWDAGAQKLTSLIQTMPGLKPETLSPMEPISFTTRDEVEVHGLLTRPAEAEGLLPLVVLPHGGPYGIVDRWGYEMEPQLLASRGYAVLQVNFRGSGGYGEGFEKSGYKEWGGKMQDDLTDATRWAIAQKIADPERICLMGGSYGAYAALMGLVREPKLYQCAVGMAGVYDLRIMRSTGDVRRSSLGRDFLDDILGADEAWLGERSPVTHAANIKQPVLLIHGAKDERAPIEHAERLRDALTEAGNPPQWYVEAKEGHGFFDLEHRRKAYTMVVEFLDSHLQD